MSECLFSNSISTYLCTIRVFWWKLSFFWTIMCDHKKRFASHYKSVIIAGLGCRTGVGQVVVNIDIQVGNKNKRKKIKLLKQKKRYSWLLSFSVHAWHWITAILFTIIIIQLSFEILNFERHFKKNNCIDN